MMSKNVGLVISATISPIATGGKPGCVDADLAALTELDDPQLLERAGGMAFGLGRFALSRRAEQQQLTTFLRRLHPAVQP